MRAGHQVGVTTFKSPAILEKEMKYLKPDLVLCPFLKDKIPKSIYGRSKCLISHPGPQGDRGPSSIDWSILNKEPVWGSTILAASEEMDAGDIYSSNTYKTAITA